MGSWGRCGRVGVKQVIFVIGMVVRRTYIYVYDVIQGYLVGYICIYRCFYVFGFEIVYVCLGRGCWVGDWKYINNMYNDCEI